MRRCVQTFGLYCTYTFRHIHTGPIFGGPVKMADTFGLVVAYMYVQ